MYKWIMYNWIINWERRCRAPGYFWGTVLEIWLELGPQKRNPFFFPLRKLLSVSKQIADCGQLLWVVATQVRAAPQPLPDPLIQLRWVGHIITCYLSFFVRFLWKPGLQTFPIGIDDPGKTPRQINTPKTPRRQMSEPEVVQRQSTWQRDVALESRLQLVTASESHTYNPRGQMAMEETDRANKVV